MMLPAQIFLAFQLDAEEGRQEINEYNFKLRIMRSDSDPFALRDIQFVEFFRLTKDMVHYLFLRLIPHMSTTVHPSGIEPRLRIFASLYFYATGSYQRTVGQNYHLSMAQNTVSNCVNEVTNLIVEQLTNDWIVFPTTFDAKIRIKRKFMERYHFPGCIGAIDCTHVAILAPPEEEHNYFNRKGYHSKNVQIVCDPDLRILNINARWGGATHDAFIWRHSIIRENLENNYNNGEQTWIIGDSGYPQEPWLMTPVLNAAPGSSQDRYTRTHISARNCIERCNGVLKGRFRCILGERVLRYNPAKCGQITIACAVLHNICINGRIPFDEPAFNNDAAEVMDNANVGQNIAGRDVRTNLIERYFTEF